MAATLLELSATGGAVQVVVTGYSHERATANLGALNALNAVLIARRANETWSSDIHLTHDEIDLITADIEALASGRVPPLIERDRQLCIPIDRDDFMRVEFDPDDWSTTQASAVEYDDEVLRLSVPAKLTAQELRDGWRRGVAEVMREFPPRARQVGLNAYERIE